MSKSNWTDALKRPLGRDHVLLGSRDQIAHINGPTADVLGDIRAERYRQLTGEGWTPQHDDAHDDGEIARAAATYAVFAGLPRQFTEFARSLRGLIPALWPWAPEWWKPAEQDPRRNLVKAGALIVADIERLDRRAAREEARRLEPIGRSRR